MTTWHVGFLPKDSGACPSDLAVEGAEAYSDEFAEQVARHLGIREYAISLDTDRGWITNRRTRASRHFAYVPISEPDTPSPVPGSAAAPTALSPARAGGPTTATPTENRETA